MRVVYSSERNEQKIVFTMSRFFSKADSSHEIGAESERAAQKYPNEVLWVRSITLVTRKAKERVLASASRFYDFSTLDI